MIMVQFVNFNDFFFLPFQGRTQEATIIMQGQVLYIVPTLSSEIMLGSICNHSELPHHIWSRS